MEGNCGEYSLAWGYWDYCLYKDSSKPDYVDLDWKIKHDMIWAEIKADPSFGAYHPTDLFTESVVTSFENEWDVMPAGRVKVLMFSCSVLTKPMILFVNMGATHLILLVMGQAYESLSPDEPRQVKLRLGQGHVRGLTHECKSRTQVAL